MIKSDVNQLVLNKYMMLFKFRTLIYSIIRALIFTSSGVKPLQFSTDLKLLNRDDGFNPSLGSRVTSLIVNGRRSDFHSFYARLSSPQEEQELKWFCGAVVLSNSWVLTSAKCVSGVRG